MAMRLPAGMRMTAKRKRMSADELKREIARVQAAKKLNNIKYEEETPAKKESDAEVDARIRERFDILSELADATIKAEVRALIVSGPAGLGKSYTVEEALSKWDPNQINHVSVKGYVKATGLYKLLYQFREKGKVIVFDDADSIFFDDTSLNLLKAVCDTNERRVVSYLSEGTLIDEDSAERIPRSFDFNGSIIFISNIDFDAYVERGHKLAPHLQAMISRAHYIDLAMKTKRDYLIRIRQVVAQGLLKDRGLSSIETAEVLDFINKNSDKLRELSLRIALKIAAIRKSKPTRWQNVARVTCCRA
jgi:hypothetical protein